MTFTLNDLVKKCELAIPIYREIAEDEGMQGDIDLYDIYIKEADKLEKLLKAIKEQLDLNKILSMSSYVIWLNLEENKAVKPVILQALRLVRDRQEYKIKELQKEVDFCNQFLNCKELQG